MDFIEELKYKSKVYTEEKYIELLKNEDIRFKILNENRYNLTWLFQCLNPKFILHLMDEKFIKLIMISKNSATHIRGMLETRNEALNNLFEMESFCELIIKKDYLTKSEMRNLSSIASEKLFDYLMRKKTNKEITELLEFSSSENQINFIKLYEDKIYEYIDVILNLNLNTIEYIFENLTHLNEVLYKKINKNFLKISQIKFPGSFYSTEIINKLARSSNFLEYRSIVNNMAKNNSVEIIELKRKMFLDTELLNVQKYSMLSSYKKILEDVNNNGSVNYQDMYDDRELYHIINRIIMTEKTELLEKFLIEDTNELISNMILDYHFEDYSYNVIKNIKNILKYAKNSDFNLPRLQIEFYERIINLGKLSIDEKIELHNLMKLYNQKEILYDITRYAKNFSYNNMKEEMINDKNYKQFLNNEKTIEVGVPVLYLDGQPFRMLIKSFNISTNETIHKLRDSYITDAGSYSYIGSEKLKTFADPKERYNFVFTDFDPNNVLHVFNQDSFSSHSHKLHMKNISVPTDRVNEIKSPTELIKSSQSYNEIIIAQNSDNTEYHNIKSNPKMKYILCYDEITNSQIKSAQNLNLGIVLVDTKKYTKSINKDAKELIISSYGKNQEDIYYTYENYENSPLCEERNNIVDRLLSEENKSIRE